MVPRPSRTFSAKSIAARRRNEHARAACASRKDQSAAARTELRRQFDRVFVAEDFHGLLELLGFEGLLQDRDRTFSQDAIEHFAVGITGDDDDRTIGLLPFHEIVNVVGRAIGQFQIEEDEIEPLFLERGDRFLDGSDDNATKADLLEEEFE